MKLFFLGVTWGAAEHLIFFPLIVGLMIFVVWRFVRARNVICFLQNTSASKGLLLNSSVKKHAFKCLFSCLGLLLLFLGMMRPQWEKKKQQVEQEGRELLIAFDISKSMLVEDVKPNRLEFAKEKVRQLLRMLDSERVGLILFSGSTVVQCPLTTDFAAFHMFLDQLDVETISSGTTAIDAAIKKALSSFSSMPTRKNKLLVVLTDGEDFSSDLAGVRQEAVQQGLTIFTLGIGTPEGGPIPLFDAEGNQTEYMMDDTGKVIISRLNEGILHNLAEQTGGTYIHVASDDDMSLLVRSVQRFEKERFGNKDFDQLEEKYPYFLFVSFICFALEWLL